MRSASIGRMLLTAALLALTFALSAGRAAPAPADDKARPSSSADKIRKDLDRVLTLDIDQQPIALAINQVQELTKINFVLDRLTLTQNGIDPDQLTVSLKLKDVKARSALRSLLTPYNLNYAILGDTVLVSTDDVAMLRQVRQRVSIDLDKIELSKALKRLARETGTNLVVDPRVGKDAQTAVTLQMEDVPLETAVRLMAEMVNLKPVRVGNTLFVTSKTNAAELRNDPDLQPAPMPGNVTERLIGLPPGVGPAVAPAAPPPPAKPVEEKTDKPTDEKSEKREKPEK
ncbi:MAG TPA: hypothetical protein VH643_13245 [Gemmataceae bacterium]|jgi:type II secretory pathway component GspD/PulD (secretin)